MRNGQRVYDADTHLQPTAEALERFLPKLIRDRIPDLDKFKSPIKIGLAGESRPEPYRHYYRFGGGEGGWGGDNVRILGDAGPRPGMQRRFQKFMGAKHPTDGGIDYADIRLQDMDEEGIDVQLMVPSGANGHADREIELAFIQANHEFLDDFCGADPARLKSLIVVSARSVDESVAEIKRWGGKRWAAGIQPYLPLDYPIDHPDLNPIWQAAETANLTVVHHSFASGYPGYRDLWSNPFIGRTASHPWGAMRMVAAFFGSGIMDRYPALKCAVLESGFGWLPFWAKRMDDQVEYMGYVADDLKQKPSDYMTGGRFFCSIVLHEGPEMVKMVDSMLGDHILMFGSDYPHAESRFPESADKVLGWENLSPDEMQKLLWGNAVRAFGEP
ncbi:MAG: amidohydrolase [Dehalococcoidia bacterium]|nr:amidohydrolase [Dehalococcoidia bacterium]